MQSVEFLNPWALLLLLSLPLLRVKKPKGIPPGSLYGRPAEMLYALISRSAAHEFIRVRLRPPFWIYASLLFLIIAIVQPVQTGETPVQEPTAAPLALVLDISPSMGESNIPGGATKLDLSVKTAHTLLESLEQAADVREVSLFVFADRPWLLSIPTTDYDFLSGLLNLLQPSLVGGGSAIVDALIAADSINHTLYSDPSPPFQADPSASNSASTSHIILISDGAETAPDIALDKLKKWQSEGNFSSIHSVAATTSQTGVRFLQQIQTSLANPSNIGSATKPLNDVITAPVQEAAAQLFSRLQPVTENEVYDAPKLAPVIRHEFGTHFLLIAFLVFIIGSFYSWANWHWGKGPNSSSFHPWQDTFDPTLLASFTTRVRFPLPILGVIGTVVIFIVCIGISQYHSFANPPSSSNNSTTTHTVVSDSNSATRPTTFLFDLGPDSHVQNASGVRRYQSALVHSLNLLENVLPRELNNEENTAAPLLDRVSLLSYSHSAHIVASATVQLPFLAAAVRSLSSTIMPPAAAVGVAPNNTGQDGDVDYAELTLLRHSLEMALRSMEKAPQPHQAGLRPTQARPLVVLYSAGLGADLSQADALVQMQAVGNFITEHDIDFVIVDTSAGTSIHSYNLQELATMANGRYYWPHSAHFNLPPRRIKTSLSSWSNSALTGLALAFFTLLMTARQSRFLMRRPFFKLRLEHLNFSVLISNLRVIYRQFFRKLTVTAGGQLLAILLLVIFSAMAPPPTQAQESEPDAKYNAQRPRNTADTACELLVSEKPLEPASIRLRAASWILGYELLNWCLMRSEKYDLAVMLHQTSQPNNYNHALALAHTGRWEEAAHAWRTLLLADPNDAASAHNLSVALSYLNQATPDSSQSETGQSLENSTLQNDSTETQESGENEESHTPSLPVGLLLRERFIWEVGQD